MRFVVFAVIAGIAGFMAWQWLQPVCAGGVIVANEQACRAAAGFDAVFCRDAMTEAAAVARRSGGTYATQSQCLARYPVCIERSDVAGWAPKPVGYCLRKLSSGAIGPIEPQYSTVP